MCVERITNDSKATDRNLFLTISALPPSLAVVWRANNHDFDRVVAQNNIGDYNLGFPGQYYDSEKGSYYNYFRDYDPKTGRYIQSDPIGLAGGINTYGYVLGNPVNYIDPYGLDTYDIDVAFRNHARNPNCISYSYGTYAGGSLVTPAGGVNGGLNGQYFSDGSLGAYTVTGVGWGWDIGAGSEANFAISTGNGGSDSWGGRFDSVNISVMGYTASLFWGGGWYGVSAGVASDGVAGSYQINEYTPITQSSNQSGQTVSACSCEH